MMGQSCMPPPRGGPFLATLEGVQVQKVMLQAHRRQHSSTLTKVPKCRLRVAMVLF